MTVSLTSNQRSEFTQSELSIKVQFDNTSVLFTSAWCQVGYHKEGVIKTTTRGQVLG